MGGLRRGGQGHPARLASCRQPQRTSAAGCTNKNKAISFAAYQHAGWPLPDAAKSTYDAQLAALGYAARRRLDDTTTPAGRRQHGGAGGHRPTATPTASNQPGDSRTRRSTSGTHVDHPGCRVAAACALTPAGVAAGSHRCEPADWPLRRAATTRSRRAATPQWGNVTPFARRRLAVRGLRAADERGRHVPDRRDRPSWSSRRRQPRRPAEGAGGVLGGRAGLGLPARPRLPLRRRPSPASAATAWTQNVKLFFALGNAMMDAGIAAWYQKYKWDFVRPITAIRHAQEGQADQLLARPRQGLRDGGRHAVDPVPGAARGDSAVPGVRLRALDLQRRRDGRSCPGFTGGDTFGATVTIPKRLARRSSRTLRRPTSSSRSRRWSQTGEDAGTSRRIGGIHFKSGDRDGRALGRQVASYV